MIRSNFIITKDGTDHFIEISNHCWKIQKFGMKGKQIAIKTSNEGKIVVDQGKAFFLKRSLGNLIIRVVGKKTNEIIRLKKLSGNSWQAIFLT